MAGPLEVETFSNGHLDAVILEGGANDGNIVFLSRDSAGTVDAVSIFDQNLNELVGRTEIAELPGNNNTSIFVTIEPLLGGGFVTLWQQQWVELIVMGIFQDLR